MANRKRSIQLHFMVSERERELIKQKMAQMGTRNMGAYLRKMAVDGYVVNLDLSAVGELVFLLRRCRNNLNQLTRPCRGHGGQDTYRAFRYSVMERRLLCGTAKWTSAPLCAMILL